MDSQITTPDWIAAVAAVVGCVATFSWLFFSGYYSIETIVYSEIIRDQTDIFRRQAGYQGQQTTISKQQACIAEKQAEIARQQLEILTYQEQERREENRKANITA